MIIDLTEEQLETLEVALRYCEVHHPHYKGEFRRLLNYINQNVYMTKNWLDFVNKPTDSARRDASIK